MQQGSMAGMDHGSMPNMNNGAAGAGAMAGMDHGGMAMPDPLVNDVGAPPGARVLSYRDLRAAKPLYPVREPTRVIEIRLTGNMERYFWSINGNNFSRAQPIQLHLGERARVVLVAAEIGSGKGHGGMPYSAAARRRVLVRRDRLAARSPAAAAPSWRMRAMATLKRL